MINSPLRLRSAINGTTAVFCLCLAPTSNALDYPPSEINTVVDTLHGVPVADPYRWLEDTDNPQVQEWTDRQNDFTRGLLDRLAVRDTLKERLAELWNYSRMGPPRERGDRYFYMRNDGLQEQDVLYVSVDLRQEPEVLIDPNTAFADHTTAINWWTPSPDGRLLAYGVSKSGSENAVLHLRDVDTKHDLPDVIDRCRYSSVAWDPDNRGFFYTRLPRLGEVAAGDETYFRRVYYHKLGADPAEDSLIWNNTEVREFYPSLVRSEDFSTLLMVLYRGSAEDNELHYIDLEDPSEFRPIVTGFNAYHEPLIMDTLLFILTNDDAPNRRVMRVNIRAPQRQNWREIIPEGSDLIEEFKIVNGLLVLKYLHQAHSQLQLFDLDGTPVREIKLPTIGTVRSLAGNWDSPEMFFRFGSYVFPRTIFRYDVENDALTVLHQADVAADPEDFESRQVWYKSLDGTDVSMFVVHRKGMPLDGDNPTLLTGYGGFMSNETPYFSSTNFLWMERGGVLALPNLRGGGEYGEDWHRAGMLENKQNTFDDFIAAAEWLIDKGYTRPQRLAIRGGSNGGLLVGATMVQRPDLFQAVICGVPLLDMIRYQLFLIARFWIPEYGSAEDPEQFKYILDYSPYHNIEEDVAYPATLFTAGEADGRVHPSHARKMVAALQAATSSERPILLWMERKAGHGQGKPTSMELEEVADEWSFLMWQLGMAR